MIGGSRPSASSSTPTLGWHSTVFPGLWLDLAALLANDLAGLRAAVERGVRDPAHAPFAARLRGG